MVIANCNCFCLRPLTRWMHAAVVKPPAAAAGRELPPKEPDAKTQGNQI